MALELAPQGSLHAVLEGHMKDRPFNKYHYVDRDKTFGTVLDRDITFKIVYQVCITFFWLEGGTVLCSLAGILHTKKKSCYKI